MTASRRVTPSQVALVESLFRITLTDEERMLLTTRPELLSRLEQQDRYLTFASLTVLACPGCSLAVCQRSAAPEGTTARSSVPDDAYRCPHCETPLTWHLGYFGAQQWFTVTPAGEKAARAAGNG